MYSYQKTNNFPRFNNISKSNNILNRKKSINNTDKKMNKRDNRDILCTNCSSSRHVYKQCPEPVTSLGFILVTFGDLKQPNHDKEIDLNKEDMLETQTRVLIESNIDRIIVSNAYYNIKFLMISRKYSVGYVEFIRGRYRPEKIDQVIYLFKQMMQCEIDKIKYSLTLENGHEYLWRDFWGGKADSPYLTNDKRISKTNYELLKIKGIDGPELDLAYIVATVKAEYTVEEWGFPKGRKNKAETDLECALREFKEESGYTDDDIKIIHNIKPLIEIFNGTNGITYRHIYYVAELITDKIPRNNVTESQRDEIGNIQFMDFMSAIEYIRDYHVPRKKLLEKLFTYYLDKLVLSNRQQLSIDYDTNDNIDDVDIVDNVNNVNMISNILQNPEINILIKNQSHTPLISSDVKASLLG